MRPLTIVLLLAVGALLGGCSWFKPMRSDSCEPKAAFRRAQSIALLRAPDGLPAPNTKNALKIPDTAVAEKPRVAAHGCLDEPPSFYADRPRPAPAK